MRLIIIILLTVMSLAMSSCSNDNPRSEDAPRSEDTPRNEDTPRSEDAPRSEDIPRSDDDSLEARAKRDPRHFPHIVSTLPEGFIPLETARRNMGRILRTLFWHTFFNVQDSEGVSFFAKDVHDDSFIVIFNNQYYVCKKQFSQIVDDATHIYEQLNRIYSIGEAMEIRGQHGIIGQHGRPVYTITITSVERLEMGTVAVYEIDFSISPSVDSRYIIDFFEAAVLQSGNRVYDFVLVSEEKVTIELSSTEFLDTLILNVPRGIRASVWQNSTRIVSLQ